MRYLFVLLLISTLLQAKWEEVYFYTILVDRVPYAFLDDKETIQKVQAALVAGQLVDESSRQPILSVEKDSTFVFDKFIDLLHGIYEQRAYRKHNTCWLLSGSDKNFRNTVGANPGQKVCLQKITNNNAGIKIETTIKDIFYNVNGFLLMRLSSIDNDSLYHEITAGNNFHNLIATFHFYRHKNKVISEEVPAFINTFMDSLSVQVSKEVGFHFSNDLPLRSLTPFHYAYKSEKLKFYAGMASQDSNEQSREGRMIIWDESGNEVFNQAQFGYSRIFGITEVNGDRSNELSISIIRGGIESIEMYKPFFNKETKQLELRRRIARVLPYSFGCGC